MHSPSLLGHVVLVVHFLFSSTLSYRLPVDEVFRRSLEKKDLVCVEDDILLSFQQYTEDSVPFCINYLSIEPSTSTVPVTSRTTTTTTTTVTTGIDYEATTVPTGTATVTITAGQVGRRQFVTPASVYIAACTQSPQNQSIISDVSSACSCLTITPTVVDHSTTVTSTRLVTAKDYKEGTISGTDFNKITTTVIISSPVNATTLPTLSSIAPSMTNTQSPPSNTTKSLSTVLSTVSGSPTTSIVTVSSGSAAVSINSTGILSGSSSSASSTFTPPPFTPPSGPPRIVSANSTLSTSGVSSGIPTGLSASSSAVGTGSSNITTPTSTSSSATSVPTLGGVCPVENGTYYTTHGQTFLIYCETNFPGPSTQGLDEPDLYACVDGCANVNLGFSEDNCYAASYFPNTLDSQNCFFKNKRNSQLPFTDDLTISAVLISGPANSITNSTTNSTTSVTPTASLSSSSSTITNSTVSPNSIQSVSTTSPRSSTVPSGFPTISTNSSSTGLPVTSNSSGFPTTFASSSSITGIRASSASGFPANSANITSVSHTPTGFPSMSANISSSSSLSMQVMSDNHTTGSSTKPISSTPSGLPTISSNTTTPPFSQPTNPLSQNTSFMSAPQSCSGCSHIAMVTSYYTSIWTTTIVETYTTGTVVTNFFDNRVIPRSPPTSAPRLRQ